MTSQNLAIWLFVYILQKGENKMTKRFLFLVIALCLSLCFVLTSCEMLGIGGDKPGQNGAQSTGTEDVPDDSQKEDGENDTVSSKDDNTQDDENDEPSVEMVTVTFDGNGGYFESGAVFTQEVEKGTLFAAPKNPEREGYIFSGWTTSKLTKKLWDFSKDVATEGLTLYAVWDEQAASILSVEGATINGTDVFMVVENETEFVALANKIVCSKDSSWKLYYDMLGQTEIPTKIASSKSGALLPGNNIFYILVTSKDQINVYTLNVHRSRNVDLIYYHGNELIHNETVKSGYSYDLTYAPSIKGYTFNYWMDIEGQRVSKIMPLDESVVFQANATANDYNIAYDTNGGEKINTTTKVTFDNDISLEVPSRQGYTFVGWKYGTNFITDKNGKGEAYSYASDITVTAEWSANEYLLTLNNSNSELGGVTGGGAYKYDSYVTVYATPKANCHFIGWFDENDNLVSSEASYRFKMGFAKTYTAKFASKTITLNYVVDGETVNTQEFALDSHINNLWEYSEEGKVFTGWYATNAFSTIDNKVTSTSALSIDKNDNAYVYGGTHTGSGSVDFTYSNGSYTVSGTKDKTVTELIIPSQFNGISVTSISNSVFSGCKGITSVVIPNSVTSIGYGTFSNCTSLTSITLPFVGATKDGTENVHFGYIFGASKHSDNYKFVPQSLKTVTITNATSIGDKAFYYCTSLTSIKLSNALTSIGSSAFCYCEGLTSIELPSSVTSIGERAFYNCTSLTSIELQNGVTSIGSSAFYNCTSLTNIEIPNSVTSI